MGDIDEEVDVFIDLTGGSYLKRTIPLELQAVLGTPSLIIMDWELVDGNICNQLPDMVITLLKAGYIVGWGCIGGHGRTGWLAAKVYKILTGCSGDEAVDYVRNNYCESAIETQIQLNDLGSNRTAKPYSVVYNSYAPGRKWDYKLNCWVDQDPVPNTKVETFEESKEISHAELQKGLEPLIGESDEEYEARTDLLLTQYYAQFEYGDKSRMWD